MNYETKYMSTIFQLLDTTPGLTMTNTGPRERILVA